MKIEYKENMSIDLDIEKMFKNQGKIMGLMIAQINEEISYSDLFNKDGSIVEAGAVKLLDKCNLIWPEVKKIDTEYRMNDLVMTYCRFMRDILTGHHPAMIITEIMFNEWHFKSGRFSGELPTNKHINFTLSSSKYKNKMGDQSKRCILVNRMGKYHIIADLKEIRTLM